MKRSLPIQEGTISSSCDPQLKKQWRLPPCEGDRPNYPTIKFHVQPCMPPNGWYGVTYPEDQEYSHSSDSEEGDMDSQKPRAGSPSGSSCPCEECAQWEDSSSSSSSSCSSTVSEGGYVSPDGGNFTFHGHQEDDPECTCDACDWDKTDSAHKASWLDAWIKRLPANNQDPPQAKSED